MTLLRVSLEFESLLSPEIASPEFEAEFWADNEDDYRERFTTWLAK